MLRPYNVSSFVSSLCCQKYYVSRFISDVTRRNRRPPQFACWNNQANDGCCQHASISLPSSCLLVGGCQTWSLIPSNQDTLTMTCYYIIILSPSSPPLFYCLLFIWITHGYSYAVMQGPKLPELLPTVKWLFWFDMVRWSIPEMTGLSITVPLTLTWGQDTICPLCGARLVSQHLEV
jgi:hypothetical protein